MDFVILWEQDGGQVAVKIDDWNQIDTAVSSWLETGRDTLIYLTTRADQPYVCKASGVASWTRSTEESRKLDAQMQADLHKERQSLGYELGLPELE